MIRRLFWGGIFLFSFGCSTHYHQVQNNGVALYLDKPDAARVVFMASPDGFEPHQAQRVKSTWVVIVPWNKPFRYFYLVDGKPYLPDCPMNENDDFGSQDCIYDPAPAF